MSNFANLMEPTARILLGAPNKRLSKRGELRFGTNGSICVQIDGAKRGTYFDHENNVGGGVLDLIQSLKGLDKSGAIEWLRQQHGDIAGEPVQADGRSKPTAVYTYEDEGGTAQFEVVRYQDRSGEKTLRQRRSNGSWGIKGVRLVPYRLPQLIEAVGNEHIVFIVEGEKDVDRLAYIGITATCNAGGAGKWRDDFAQHLEAADVVILPDNDEAGRRHAETVARSLKGNASRIRVVDLPNFVKKGDASDFLDAGGTPEQIWQAVEAAPDWTPSLQTAFPLIWYGSEDKGSELAWLVRDLLPAGGLSMLYGPPGSSKSFAALDLALHVAHGTEWFQRRVQQCGVIYVSGEGSVGMKRRMRAWRQEKGSDALAPFALLPQSINLHDDDDGALHLSEDIKAIASHRDESIGLVVLDTLSRMIGSGDEDRAPSIMAVVRRAETIQRETGAHVLIVHHSGKEKARGARGSNALEGAVDTSIEVSAIGNDGLFELRTSKVKDGEEIQPIRYTLAQTVVGQDEEGENITSCVIRPTDTSPGEDRKKPQLNPTEKIGVRALEEALCAASRPSPGGRVPHNVRVVDIAIWRETAYKMGISSSDEPDAKRKAFHRMKQSLHTKSVVGIWGEDAWKA